MDKQKKDPKKKPYRTPQVVVYGDIREITNNSPKNNKGSDNASNKGQNKTGAG